MNSSRGQRPNPKGIWAREGLSSAPWSLPFVLASVTEGFTRGLASSVCWIWWSGWGLRTTTQFQNILTAKESYLSNVTSMTAQQWMGNLCQLRRRGKIEKQWENYRSCNCAVPPTTHTHSLYPTTLAAGTSQCGLKCWQEGGILSVQELDSHLGNTYLERPKYLPSAHVSV